MKRSSGEGNGNPLQYSCLENPMVGYGRKESDTSERLQFTSLHFTSLHLTCQRNPRADFLQNGLVGSPFSPRYSQQTSPTPQFKSINSSGLSLLHSPTLTSIHNLRKKQTNKANGGDGVTFGITKKWTLVVKVMSLLLNICYLGWS